MKKMRREPSKVLCQISPVKQRYCLVVQSEEVVEEGGGEIGGGGEGVEVVGSEEV